MPATSEAERFFTERRDIYARFIALVRYPQGLRATMLTSSLLGPDLRILEAGCGTGALTLAVHDALAPHGFEPAVFHAFDLTPAMLDRLRTTLHRRGIERIALARCDVLALHGLPEGWTDYDLVVSASMLEYVPKDRFAEALAALRARLRDGGRMLLFVTQSNPLTRALVGRWWQSNLYTRLELRDAFRAAGFSTVTLQRFPLRAAHLSLWGHIVEATR